MIGLTLVAILGTTISPYLFFWQVSEEVEEESRAGQSDACASAEAPHQGEELEIRNIDGCSARSFSNLVMFFIILTTAITLNRHGITNIETFGQAAEALRPFAGNFAATVFTLGGQGSRVSLCHPHSGRIRPHTLSPRLWAGAVGWNKKPRQGRWFYAPDSVLDGSGASRLDFIGINPVKALN